MKKQINNTQVTSLWINLVYRMFRNRNKLNDDIDNNYRICREISNGVINKSGININIQGRENIPDSGSTLIVSNHRSFFDILILMAAIDKTSSFAAASELYSYPILNKYIESIDCVSIDRNTTDIYEIKKQLTDISESLKKGTLVLFSEGECNYNGDGIGEFKKGGFIGAASLDACIVPTCINISDTKSLGRWVIPTSDVDVLFGESFKPSEVFSKKASAKALANYTREKVVALQKQYKR